MANYKMSIPVKVKRKKLFLVETISTFKHQYIVEATSVEEAESVHRLGLNDSEFFELDQEHIDEHAFSTRKISTKEFAKLCKNSMNGHLGHRLINK